MDDRTIFRSLIEQELLPKLQDAPNVHLDLNEEGWSLYRQDNDYDAEVYWLVQGQYDAPSTTRLQKLIEKIESANGRYDGPS